MTYENFPDVWGPGQLLAFSGVDGRTSWFEPFVLHTASKPGDLRVKLPVELSVTFHDLAELTFECVTGDAIAAGGYCAVFADDHTLVGTVPPGASMQIGGKVIIEPVSVWCDGDVQLVAACRDGRWLLARRAKDEPFPAFVDPAPCLVARTAYLKNITLPAGLSGAERRLLLKAISIAKVNVEAPSGCIKQRWTTPDRWPHRHMWLWDSAFHAVGIANYDLKLAQDAVLAMLEQVQDDGMLPHTIRAGIAASEITQPPILAWATLTVLKKGGDLAWAETCRRYLFEYLEWDRLHRDQNENSIPEWFIEGETLCRCGECGLDNSPVYDGAVLLDAPDFGAFLSHDYACLAEIARLTGDEDMAGLCQEMADRLGKAVREELWWEERDLFFHRDFSGAFVDSEAVSGFMPLFAGVASEEQADRLVRQLADPAMFGAPVPVPSMSMRSGTYSKDMWRGPSWMNVSYLIYLGLRRYGFDHQARKLRVKLLKTVGDWYEETGCFWEYYDSLGFTPPGELDRKQRLSSGTGIGPISDYHWTAAVTAALLFEET